MNLRSTEVTGQFLSTLVIPYHKALGTRSVSASLDGCKCLDGSSTGCLYVN